MQVEFIGSSEFVDQCPKHNGYEYAFIGRSNVGKSSLINLLTNQRIARISNRPGKTQTINHFCIDKTWYLVDLPGYGYAKVSKKMRKAWEGELKKYLFQRDQMALIFVLIDSRHHPLKVDMDFITWLGEQQVPFAIVFTKADKLSKTKLSKNIEGYKTELLKHWEELPPHFLTSSETGQGKAELFSYIESINQELGNRSTYENN